MVLKQDINDPGRSLTAEQITQNVQNFQATPQTGFVNPNQAIQTQQAKPVTMLSSQAGENLVNDNVEKLGTIESSFTPQTTPLQNTRTVQSGDTLSGIAQEEGVGVGDISGFKSGDPDLIFPGEILTIRGNSPAQQQMADSLNKSFASGAIPPEAQEGLRGVLNAQDTAIADTASARGAFEGKDFLNFNTLTKQAQSSIDNHNNLLSDFFKQSAPARQQFLSSLTPGQKEIEVGRQLTDLRGQIDQFNLQTEEDKFREFEGQTLGFAGGRASEIDIKAEFKRTRMALGEKNLLAELGFEQSLREMEGKSAEAQLGFIQNDFELQSQIQEQLDQKEEQLFNMARTLRSDSQNTLLTILDSLEGVNPDELPPEALQRITALATQTGIPMEVLTEALKTQYQREVYERSVEQDKLALDEAKEARLGREGEEEDSVTFSDTQIAKGAENAGMSIQEFQALPTDEQNGFINGGKVGEGRVKEDVESVISVAKSQGDDVNDVIDDVRTLIAASGFDPDTFDGGTYEKKGFFDKIKGLFGK